MRKIIYAVLDLFNTIFSAYMEKYLSDKHTKKNEKFNRKNNFKREICNTLWVPLCEIVENLIEEICVKKTTRLFYEEQDNNYKQIGFSLLFQYLNASKRGGIGPIKDNILIIKRKLKVYNDNLDKVIEKEIKYIDGYVIDTIYNSLPGVQDMEIYYEEKAKLVENLKLIFTRGDRGDFEWIDAIDSIGDYDLAGERAVQAEIQESDNGQYSVMELDAAILSCVNDIREQTNTHVDNAIKGFKVESLGLQSEIVEELRKIKKELNKKIDEEYALLFE